MFLAGYSRVFSSIPGFTFLGLLRWQRTESYYVGSMVSGVYRTLIKGGVFLYPPTGRDPGGKLRLLYEANPIAYIVEQAGGRATDGERRILDIQPEHIHQRTPLVLGGKAEMEEFDKAPGAVPEPARR
ncbi:MAG: hypothetical protein KIT09_33860 [Bryobacteraceae bacterium]|nr:hypothetical protein [Bryobacteraceae bacterium]